MKFPGKKPDFSGVSSGADTTANTAGKADFSRVSSSVDSTAQKIGGSAEQRYTVKSGETLSHIAKQHYGNANAWQSIYDANRDQLDNPDLIKAGQVLRIPAGDDHSNR